MNRRDFLNNLYIEKDYLKIVSASQMGMLTLEDSAEFLFATGNYADSATLYKKLNNTYKEGYCYLHNGNIEKANLVWSTLEDESSALIWGKLLLSIFMSKVSFLPTYFQIRNFTEVDLGLFLHNKHFGFVHKFVAALPFLERVNPEVYKFVGASFLNAGFSLNALNFLEHWKQIQFNDPEVHFLLARCYKNLNLEQKSRQAIHDCQIVAPEYFPAKNFYNMFQK